QRGEFCLAKRVKVEWLFHYPPEFPGAIWQRRGLENLLCLSAFSAILPKDRPLLGLTLFFFS
ncbi:hypothetical protein, partial [Bacteroides acidifaciens]|uniref:hypothetical protein n=1 Tax=Bacteroides acidifaciens TaxID=85831 RepID=UPI002576A665